MAAAAEKFACRPSLMVGLDDPVLALDFDLAAAARLMERQRAALLKAQGEACRHEHGTKSSGHEERW